MNECVHLAGLLLLTVTSAPEKVHIWSSLLDFTQIIDAVVVHLKRSVQTRSILVM